MSIHVPHEVILMDSATLHIKVSPEVARGLKNLAKKRNVPVGELVRRAVASSYQLDWSNLPDHQRRAVAAYQGGYISLGKLAEEMGLTVVDVRRWLSEHDIVRHSVYCDDDAGNA